MRKAIEGPAKPRFCFSHAIVANGFVFVTGQGPMDNATGASPDNFEAQVRQTLGNLKTVLGMAGAEMKDVVKVTVYLTDLTRFAAYDGIYREFFPTEPPARTTIGCQLPGILVEMDCIAVLPD
ncbi:MAG TPA: RidA family protein [Stellaceae bacterium]|nr:RidA family protein [Stellaceae bacterium]